jgi:hypothetical protein
VKDSGYLVVSVNIVRNPVLSLLAKGVDVYRWLDPTHTYHFHSPSDFASRLASHFDLVRFECIDEIAERMEALKRKQDTQAKTARGTVRRMLKYVKNEVLLREELYLFLFSPKSLRQGLSSEFPPGLP